MSLLLLGIKGKYDSKNNILSYSLISSLEHELIHLASSYYDKDKILIDGGILLSDDYLTLSEVLTGISGLISRESLDESLKDLLKEDGLEMLHETIEEKIKI